MNPQTPRAQEPDPAGLTIGELARQTGVTPAVIRMWEARHGFPTPQRLESGHRRYGADDVERVREVVRRRDGGVRLEVAIAEARPGATPATHSVYAELRRAHPELTSHRLRKSTLLALSWAIEDECCAHAQRSSVFGAFQEERYYRLAADRWAEIARVAATTMVLAEFPAATTASTTATGPGRPVPVNLAGDSPMRREWAVICDGPGFRAALTAWELPGQRGVAERDRTFEAIWTVDPRAVRRAATVCARVADDQGVPGAGTLLASLVDEEPVSAPDHVSAGALFARALAYVDHQGR